MRLINPKTAWKFVSRTTPMYILSRFRPIPFWVHLYVTRKCNLACDYCQLIEYPNMTNPKQQDLDTEKMKQVIDKLHSLGTRFVSYFGGEPTIRKDLVELIRHADKKKMINHLSTNGAFLTPEYIDNIGEAGIHVINLSVDSVLEFGVSGKDYTKCKQVLTDLLEGRKKYGFEINVNMVLTSQNVDSTLDTIQFIDKLDIPISVAFINNQDTYSRSPLWDFEKEEFTPNSDMVSNRTDRKKELVAKKLEKIQALFGDEPPPSIYFETKEQKQEVLALIDEIISLKKKGVGLIEPMQYFLDMKKFAVGELEDWNCTAGLDHLSIDSDGNIQLCASSPTEKLSIFDLDKNYHKTIQKMRDIRLHKGYDDDNKLGCKKLCLSNCLYTSSYWMTNPLFFYKEIFS